MNDELKALLVLAEMSDDSCIDEVEGVTYQVIHYLFITSGVAFAIDYVQDTQIVHSCSLHNLDDNEWWMWYSLDTEECVSYKFVENSVTEQKCNEKITDLLKRLLDKTL